MMKPNMLPMESMLWEMELDWRVEVGLKEIVPDF